MQRERADQRSEGSAMRQRRAGGSHMMPIRSGNCDQSLPASVHRPNTGARYAALCQWYVCDQSAALLIVHSQANELFW